MNKPGKIVIQVMVSGLVFWAGNGIADTALNCGVKSQEISQSNSDLRVDFPQVGSCEVNRIKKRLKRLSHKLLARLFHDCNECQSDLDDTGNEATRFKEKKYLPSNGKYSFEHKPSQRTVVAVVAKSSYLEVDATLSLEQMVLCFPHRGPPLS